MAYIGKLIVHPKPMTGVAQVVERAAIGPIHGGIILSMGAFYCLFWGAISVWSLRHEGQRGSGWQDRESLHCVTSGPSVKAAQQ